MKLYPIRHNYKAKLWCGIAALAAVTGRSTKDCRDAVAEARGYNYGTPQIMGIYNSELVKALALLGYWATPVCQHGGPASNRPTLSRFIESDDHHHQNPVIVSLTTHYVTLFEDQFIDNHTKVAVPISGAPRLGRRVAKAWVITKAAAESNWVPTKVVRKQDTARKSRAEAVRLAKEHDITIDLSEWKSSEHWIWVYCGRLEGEGGTDPYDGDHICYNWDEALDMVKGYVKALSEK